MPARPNCNSAPTLYSDAESASSLSPSLSMSRVSGAIPQMPEAAMSQSHCPSRRGLRWASEATEDASPSAPSAIPT
jgi:hypothetical protein